MHDSFFDILRLLGSLAFFIFGLKTMSEGIQKLVGPWLSAVMANRSKSKFGAVLMGFLSTALVQSSSATTLMVVSFVNAGLLRMKQSIAVIMGANIGTTITAWLIVFFGFSSASLGSNVFLIVLFGVPLLFVHRLDWKSLGGAIVGFALMFLGVNILIDMLESNLLVEHPTIAQWFNNSHPTGFWVSLAFLLGGTILTFLLQSSAATMVLTLCLVGLGLPLEFAAAAVLGENIGTTISANVVADAGNVFAKRAARAHLLFNVIGAIGVLLIFEWFVSGMQAAVDFVNPSLDSTNVILSRQWALCLFHTSFNLINTFVLFFFIDGMAKLIVRVVRPKDEEDEEFSLQFINNSLQNSEVSLAEAKEEIVYFGKVIQKMSGVVASMVSETELKSQKKALKKVHKLEQLTDNLEVQIGNYLSKVGQQELTHEGSSYVYNMLSMIIDLERMGDIFYVMAKGLEAKVESKVYFLPKQREGILKMFKIADRCLEVMVENLTSPEDKVNIESARKSEKELDEFRDELKRKHIRDIEAAKYGARSGMIYIDLFSSLERIGDHAVNVSESLAHETS
jgi:phosphate:Na+ symporter